MATREQVASNPIPLIRLASSPSIASCWENSGTTVRGKCYKRRYFCERPLSLDLRSYRCGGLSAPAVSELRVTSPEISARSNHGLKSLACQALRDDVFGALHACCADLPRPPSLPPRINLRDLFCYRTSAFLRGNPKPFSGFQKNLLCNSHSSNTYYKRDYFFTILSHTYPPLDKSFMVPRGEIVELQRTASCATTTRCP